jgi:hypothetical protein
LAGPLILLAWQAAPIAVQSDSTGRVRISVGYGAGQYEARHYNCAGELIGADPHQISSGGVQVDAWPERRLRVSGFAGRVADEGVSGAFGGFQGAVEGQIVGLGLGYVWVPGTDPLYSNRQAYPSVYLRLGDIDAPHFRFDLGPPSAAYPGTGWLKMGIGFNQGHLRRTSGYFGLGLGGIGPDTDGEVGVGPYVDLILPAWREFDLALGGAWRPSRQYNDWSLTVGGRYAF